MARFLVRSIVSTIITMLLVSITLFILLEIGSGDVSLKILGVFSTEEQRASFRKQMGLDRAAWLRYVDWLVGTDWQVKGLLDYPLVVVANPQTGEPEWWQSVGGDLVHWEMEGGEERAQRDPGARKRVQSSRSESIDSGARPSHRSRLAGAAHA